MAPEVLKKGEKYDSKCDIWSSGIILYLLLVGEFPYAASNIRSLVAKILRGKQSYRK